MKWSVVTLIVFGIIAAISASLLINALRADKMGSKGNGEVNAVVAVQTMPAMSVISSQQVELKKVPKEGLSTDYCSDTIQAVGKVLSVPVVEGQVLTRGLFITEGSGAQLAAALPHGMRAVSVPVANYSVMDGLLYPGCLVDVIATFRLRSSDTEKGQAVSMTLLHSIQVLAIRDESIVSKQGPEEEAAKKVRGRNSSSMQNVTLMVDTKQTEALQLAMQYGNITLAMRNPLDHRPVDVEATVLSEGRLAKLGELLGTSVFAAQEEPGYLDSDDFGAVGLAALIADPNRPAKSAAATRSKSADRLKQLLGQESGSRSRPQWEITVIRGNKVTEEVLEMGENQ
ncbi:MAG: Flp pilus assembly protein CpaB [Planctomycetota bacterium]|jgi:pilus assembly protein CpaB